MPNALRVKAADPEVPPDTPFEHDALARDQPAEILTQFVSRIEDPFVLAINAPWGSGKTTFVKMWRQSLKNSDFPTLYFNAWETDFSDNPFVSLVGELSSAIEEMSESKPTRKHLDRAKRIAVAIGRRAIPVAIRVGTAGVIDLDKEIEKELSALAGELAQDQIESYSSSKAAIAEFRDALEDLVSSLRSKSGHPLIFFIDELDRCRPTYAIELLEKAKHLFSVPGIVFVLSLDKNQLSHAIRAVYGAEFDADGYLRRFIDMDFILPEPEPGNYTGYLLNRLGVPEHFEGRRTKNRREEYDLVRALMTGLIGITPFSLRQQMQCVSRLLVVLNTIPDDHKLYDIELVTMIVLREWNNDLFLRYEAGTVDNREVVAALRELPGGKTLFSHHIGNLVEAALASGADEIADSATARAYYKELAENETIDVAEKDHAVRISELIGYVQRYDRGPGMKHTLKRIALTMSFIIRDAEQSDV